LGDIVKNTKDDHIDGEDDLHLKLHSFRISKAFIL